MEVRGKEKPASKIHPSLCEPHCSVNDRGPLLYNDHHADMADLLIFWGIKSTLIWDKHLEEACDSKET